MPVSIVAVHEVGNGVVGHVHVEVPVEIEVGEDDSNPLAVISQSGFGRRLAKRTVAVPEIDGVG